MKKLPIIFKPEKGIFCLFCFLNLTGYDTNNNALRLHPLRKYIKDSLKNKIDISKYFLLRRCVYKRHQGQFVQWILRKKYDKKNLSDFYSKKDLKFFKRFDKYFKNFINKEKKIIPWKKAKKDYLLEKEKNGKKIIKELENLIKKINIDFKKINLTKIVITPNFLDAYRYGYGPKIKKIAFIVYGPLKKNDYRLIKHEFLHSVVNPIILRNKYLLKKSKSLNNKKINQELRKKGYSDLAVVIEESIIRALNVKLSDLSKKSKSKLINQEKRKGFYFIDKIYDKLKERYKEDELLDILDNIVNNIKEFVL